MSADLSLSRSPERDGYRPHHTSSTRRQTKSGGGIGASGMDYRKRGEKSRGEWDEEMEKRYQGSSGVFEGLEGAKGKSGPLQSIEGWIIFVTGIREDCPEEEVYEAFEEFGNIKALHYNLDRRTGYVKGYVLIEYSKFEEAKRAIAEMNDKEFMERRISVDWAFVTEPEL